MRSPSDFDSRPLAPALTVFGALASTLAEPDVSDVVVNGEDVWVDRGRGFQRAAIWLDEPAREYGRRLIAAGGRHVDEVTPIADARLGDVRVHVVLPPIAVGHATVSLRVLRPGQLTLESLLRAGTFTPNHDALLRRALTERVSVMFTGSAGAGKTTALRALLAQVDQTERVVTIEDTAELCIPHAHVIALESRQANLEGAGAVELADLVRASLRMRPDRIVVGECRGAEIRDMLAAMTSGHSGGTTLHAQSLHEVPTRLETLGLLAGLSTGVLARQVVGAFGLVAHLERRAGARRCVGMAQFARVDDHLELRAVE